MPELPEVETERQYLHRTSVGKSVMQVIVSEPRILKDTSPPALTVALLGHTIVDTGRHGKYLFAILENGASLIFHFGMTGGLAMFDDDYPWPPYTRFALLFSDTSHLTYHDPRKLGRVSFTTNWREWIRVKGLGPDALSVQFKAFREQLANRKGAIKPLLMNQEVIAGIGNLYAGEILFLAGIHPRRAVGSLTIRDLQRIYTSMRTILRTAIRRRADEAAYPRTYLIHQRFPDGCCPKCGKILEHLSMNGRTAYFCPDDQPYEA